MIASTSNAQVKQVCALCKKSRYRKETGLFVVEGPKMFRELPKGRIHQAYATEKFAGDPAHAAMLRGVDKLQLVTEEVLKAMSDTQTPQGILAVARMYQYSMADLKSRTGPALLMILETIQDPGNLGTILRAGEGAGITGIIMDENTADIYNPKVIRSTMGSIYRVPFLSTPDLPGTLAALKDQGIRLYAADLEGSESYDREDYTQSCGFLIGNEARGLKDRTKAMADRFIRIPMAGQVESLNAAVASSILMFEAARQRREKS